MVQEVKAETKAAEFKLPTGVEVGQDGKLVDNRSWYQGTRILWNDSLATMQEKHDAAKKGTPKETTEEGWSWKTPFNAVGSMFTGVYNAVKNLFINLFQICGFCKDEEAKGEGEKTDGKKAEVPAK